LHQIIDLGRAKRAIKHRNFIEQAFEIIGSFVAVGVVAANF